MAIIQNRHKRSRLLNRQRHGWHMGVFGARIAWILLLLAAAIVSGCTQAPSQQPSTPESPAATPSATTPNPPATVEELLAVHFLDVGQGDATLLQGPDFTFLIDAGRHNANDVVPHLERLGVEELDLLIGTHPHADHIGQIDRVLARFPVGEVWMSGDAATTATYERILDALADSDAGYHEPRAGEVYDIGAATLQVIHPVELGGSLDDNSVSLRIVYGQVAFLFTGDAGTAAERAMIERGEPLQAQVLQLGHHGSRTSSGRPFLEAVAPQIAIWSASASNPFDHPHPEVVERLACLEITVYGTADHGTITVITEGTHIRLEVDLPNGTRGPPTPVPAVCGEASHESGAPDADRESDDVGDNWNGYAPGRCGPGQIDINAASLHALQEIIHIGPERAQMLMGLRPYTAVEDMKRIPGIGPASLEDIAAQGLACVETVP